MSMCSLSCVVRRGCLVCYDQCILLAKLLAFALLHSVLQGPNLPVLLQVSLISYFCIPVPCDEKDIRFGC